jgi:hypothetical protein
VNLTHLDEQNKPKMVDVSDKDNTTRIATASGIIEVSQSAFDAVVTNTAKKRTRASNCCHCSDSGNETDLNAHPYVPSSYVDLG